jgi:chaperonin GroEL
VAGSRTRRVLFQPAAYAAMQRGMHQIVEAVRPTLGPRPRTVAIAAQVNRRPPEMLDDGGLIARRIIQLADPDEDMGAMYLRQLLWSLHEKVGDGTATAAVLYQSIYDQGVQYIVSGGEPMQLRRHFEQGLRIILDQLQSMVCRVEGKEALARLADTVCADPPLARMLGEIFDVIGEYGQLEIREGRSRELEREYVEGMYWKSGLLSRQMMTDPKRLRAELEDAAILISDLEIKEPRDLVPVLEGAVQGGVRSLLVVTSSVSDGALGMLRAARESAKIICVPVKTPGLGSDEQARAMEDLAVLTGGHPLVKAAGETLQGFKFENLGRARRAWADSTYMGIVGGKGEARRLRRHIADLKAAFCAAEEPAVRKGIRERLGKLMGGSAILSVGAVSDVAIKTRKNLAERTAEALRGAVRDGILPGGGAALLACRPALRRELAKAHGADEKAAYRILLKAMEVPIRSLLANSGLDVGRVMADIALAGPGFGCDLRTGHIVNMAETGISDPAGVTMAVVRGTVASVALALTVDVLVHRRIAKKALTP